VTCERSSLAKGRLTASKPALTWVLAQGEDIVPIPGTKRRKYLEQNAEGINILLTEEELRNCFGRSRLPLLVPIGKKYR
jgi:aryl-alcohol dehydrogenase-like predicted oxidoreductase